jgi:hypothetical protein
MAADTVTLALEGEVPIAAFAKAVGNFEELVRVLSSDVAREGNIRWVVEDLRIGSTVVTIRAVSSDEEAVDRVVGAYSAIGRSLQRNQTIPYSGRVIRLAENIRSVLNGNVTAVRFETPLEDITIYGAGIGLRVMPATSAHGAVTGRVQTLTSRNRLRFTLYDLLEDRALSCYLDPGNEELIRGAWDRMARVEGWLSRDSLTGQPVSIRQIRNVTLLPEVPAGTYRQARGAAPLEPGDLSAENAIRRLRDA